MKIAIYIALFAMGLGTLAQGGFSFLNITSNARAAGLGGYTVSPGDGDLTMSYHNPAVMDSVITGDFAAVYNPYFADINRMMFTTAIHASAIGSLAIGVVYMDYGTFDEMDATGVSTGEFSGQDYVIYVSKAHSLGPFSMGVNLKYAGSVISSVGMHALAIDMGGLYRHPTHNFTIGMVFKNIGAVVANNSAAAVSLPFDVEIGTTIKPQYMPARFTISLFNLTRKSGDVFAVDGDPRLADKLFRYISLGTEFLLGKNIELLLGYNHRRHQELRLTQGAYGAGFSYGILLRIKELELRFTQSRIHAAGGSSFISLGGNFETMKKIF